MAIKIINFPVEIQNVNQQNDRLISRVFTSDEHSIELNFEILDIENLSGMTAEVMIYTEDKSLFVNKATFKAPNSYSYIMQPQEDARRGLCIVQLLLKDGSKILTSPKFRFEIERSVNDEVVQESGIVNTWEDFKKDRETWSKEYQEKLDAWSEEMTEKVNEMKANAEQEEANRVKAEKLRVSAETKRKTAESSRASAESSRKTAETSRVEAEEKRANAEVIREHSYIQRESSRDRDFQASEEKRIKQFSDAEAKRVTAEQSRASEEAKRVSAETARKSAETKRASEETKRVNAEKERESKFSGWDKTMSGVLPEATSTKAGIVKVEGKSGETAPYTVYSKAKLAEEFNSIERGISDRVHSQMNQLSQGIDGSINFIRNELDNYQPKLTAGKNITINKDGTISAVNQLTFNKSGGITTAYLSAGSIEMYDPMSGISGTVAMQPKDGKLVTSDDINFKPMGGGRTAVEFDATDLFLAPKAYAGHKVEVWTKMNQGSGSGLDADLLDGKHADQFVLKSEQSNSGFKKITGSFVHYKVEKTNNSSYLKLITATDLIIYDFKLTLSTNISSEYGKVIGKIDLPQKLSSSTSFYMIRPDNDSKFQVNLTSNGELKLATSGLIYSNYPYYANGFIII